MKANAPEKIYLTKNLLSELFDGWDALPSNDFISIEYTRTDAFIEKALAYLHDKFYFSNVFYGIVSTDFNATEEMFEDFRTYMEEE